MCENVQNVVLRTRFKHSPGGLCVKFPLFFPFQLGRILVSRPPPAPQPGTKPAAPRLRRGLAGLDAGLWSWRCPFDSDRRRTTFSQTAASPRFGKKWRSSSPSLTPPPAQEGTNATLVLPGGRDKYQRFFPLGGDSNRSILPGGEYVGRVETFKT